MLSRREKLLNRPWQLRRYNNHRRKVLSALPAIDVGPPKEHKHVTHKLKKMQKENERCAKIEEDNFKLLHRMGDIMRKSRVENSWKIPPPDFLHRVGIFYRTRTPSPAQNQYLEENEKNLKKSRCLACSAKQCSPEEKIPEERIPWEPPRLRLSRRSSSTEALISSDFDFFKKPLSASNFIRKIPKKPRAKSEVRQSEITLSAETVQEKKLVLKQNHLNVEVNFPPRAEVRIRSGKEAKNVRSKNYDLEKIITIKKI